MAAPSFRSRSAVSYGLGTTLVTSWPAGIVRGDIATVVTAYDGDRSGSLNNPLARDAQSRRLTFESAQGNTTYCIDVVQYDGATPAPTYTWGGANINRAAQIGLWKDGASFFGLDQVGATSATPTITGPTIDVADSTVLWFVLQFQTTVTPPTSPRFVAQLDDINGVGVLIADAAFASAGASGSLAGTLGRSTRHLVSTLAIRPVAAAASSSRLGLLGVG